MQDEQGPIDAGGLRIGVAVSRYHDDITSALERGAADAFARAGGRVEDLVVVQAPGAFELPLIAQALLARPDVDGVVALGCVITGETRHDRYIASSVADAFQRLSLEHRKPCAFGVLTCPDIEHARARAGGSKGNKGAEAMGAAVGAIRALRQLASHGGSGR